MNLLFLLPSQMLHKCSSILVSRLFIGVGGQEVGTFVLEKE